MRIRHFICTLINTQILIRIMRQATVLYKIQIKIACQSRHTHTHSHVNTSNLVRLIFFLIAKKPETVIVLY